MKRGNFLLKVSKIPVNIIELTPIIKKAKRNLLIKG